MATIGKVRAVFTASTSGLTSGVNNAAASMRRMEGAVSSLRGGMNALVAIQGVQFFGSLVSSATSYIRSLIAMGAAQAEVVDQTSKLAARVGMAYGEFAGLALAGELAGVGMDAVANAASKADIAFVRAQQGSVAAQAAFSNLGLSMDELGGMSSADRFAAIAQAISELPTEAERAAAAVAIFGRAGLQLLPMFSGGADAIREAREQAERLGLALTTAQGQDIEAMNDSFTLASKAISGVIQQVVAYLSPAVKGVTDAFVNFIGSIGGANIGQSIGNGILQGARFLAQIGDWLITNLSAVWEYVKGVGVSWGDVFKFASQVSAALAGVGRAWLGVFQTFVRIVLTPTMNIIDRAAQLATYIPGVDDAQMAAVRAANDSFRETLDQSIADNFTAAGENFAAAAGDGVSLFADQAAGPLTTALDAAIGQAVASAGAIDEAGQGAATTIADAMAGSSQALKGIDSRSAEGVAEMFRLMRGGDTVQEQQLAVLETIAENTSGGDESYPFAFE